MMLHCSLTPFWQAHEVVDRGSELQKLFFERVDRCFVVYDIVFLSWLAGPVNSAVRLGIAFDDGVPSACTAA